MRSVQLDDKYSLEEGRVYMTGTQALVRLMLMQAARDQAALEAVIEPVIRANLEQWFMLYPFRPDC